MVGWDIELGETLLRRELHDRWGGGRYGGIEPAVAAHCVFAFTEPEKGEAYGYRFDGWHDDGTFHYSGDGQVGDQSPAVGGNKSLLDAKGLGRPIRLFRSVGTSTTYLGEFALADPPYYRADSPDRNGDDRSAMVFRLQPVGDVVRDSVDDAGQQTQGPVEVPLEAANVDSYVADRPNELEDEQAVRREALLVGRYVAWLESHGQESVRHRVPIPTGGYLYTDVYNKATCDLVEAKASAARSYIRSGLGQLLDYARFVDHNSKAVLVPVRPADDLVDLLHSCGCAIIWEDGKQFKRVDP